MFPKTINIIITIIMYDNNNNNIRENISAQTILNHSQLFLCIYVQRVVLTMEKSTEFTSKFSVRRNINMDHITFTVWGLNSIGL